MEESQNSIMELESKFKCSECGKNFQCNANLRRHISNIHEKVKYPCNFCEKVYSDRQRQRAHIKKTHTDQDSQALKIENDVKTETLKMKIETFEIENNDNEEATDESTSNQLVSNSEMAKRSRNNLTTDQVEKLTEYYNTNKYISKEEIEEKNLCEKLNMSFKQIRLWFQNRRDREKRKKVDIGGSDNDFANQEIENSNNGTADGENMEEESKDLEKMNKDSEVSIDTNNL